MATEQLAAAQVGAPSRSRVRRSSPPGSRSRGGCRPATTASRSSTSRTRATTGSSSARRTGAGATSSARRPRQRVRCSSAARSTTRSAATTSTSSTTASASRSIRSRTPTGTAGRPPAETEREQLGIAWEAELREETAFKLGLDAIDLSFAELIPALGEPVAVQRKVEYTARSRARVERALLSRPRDPAPRRRRGSARRWSTTRSRPRR